jgi:hypothetical protein
MFILSIFACSPSVDTFTALSNDAAGSTKDEPVDQPTPDTVEIVYDHALTGFVEARPYYVEDGEFLAGPPLFVAELDGEALFVNLPNAARTPEGDISTEPVVYAIALRDTDEEGRPGIYTGLSGAELVWLPGDSEDGGSLGWNLALHFGTEDIEWLEVKAPLVTPSLVGAEQLTVAGTLDIPMEEGLRLAFATGTEAEHLTFWDNPIGEDWFGSLPSAPLAGAVSERAGMYSAMFGGFAYVDAGDDGVRTDEPYIGRLYADAAPVVISWVAPAGTLTNALAIRRNHARMGWTALARVEDGLVPVNEEMAITVGEF